MTGDKPSLFAEAIVEKCDEDDEEGLRFRAEELDEFLQEEYYR